MTEAGGGNTCMALFLVIPDVFYRESTAFPMQGLTNERTEEKDAGFPLTLSSTFVIGETGGNDRGDRAERPEGRGTDRRGRG